MRLLVIGGGINGVATAWDEVAATAIEPALSQNDWSAWSFSSSSPSRLATPNW